MTTEQIKAGQELVKKLGQVTCVLDKLKGGEKLTSLAIKFEEKEVTVDQYISSFTWPGHPIDSELEGIRQALEQFL